MSNKVNRRDFLKIMGWGGVGATLAGCDMPTTVTLEEGKEQVTSYLIPEEYVIPGVGVYYASTCQQCPAGCGLHGRVREGRVLKLEGNPESPINKGKLCQMGQAGVQAHYNPDRITRPMVRKGSGLTAVSWDEALSMIQSKTAGLQGDRFAWFTDTVSGHQAVLMDAYRETIGSSRHYVHETINNSVARQVNQDMLGDPQPHLRFDKARVVLSFGADFLGTWQSPVHNAVEYAAFREAPRGVLVQVEPKMTLTGANADLWVAVRPGTEGIFALAVANALAAKDPARLDGLPENAQRLVRRYDVKKAARITGAAGEHIVKVAGWLAERSPSLVLSGASAEGHEHGYETVAATMLLNIILGNVGETIEASGTFPFPQLAARVGGTKDLMDFAKAVDGKELDVVFFRGANPVFTAPEALGLKDKLNKVGFKVAFSMFEDETTRMADVVLPMYSPLEDWGTHAAAYQPGQSVIGIQQPLMQPLYDQTRGFGDVMLSLLKMQKAPGYSEYPDYYAYLRDAFSALPDSVKGGASDNDFWASAMQKGVLTVESSGGTLTANVIDFDVPENSVQEGAYYLVPSARLGMWDGRHANIPWLQEAPDQISKVVWDSWAEIHPRTAHKLGVKTGDAIKITSANGSIEANVYVFKGIHPDAIAVPMGQGHEAYGRYAKGRGVNPLKILALNTDSKTGELAHHGTKVQVSRTRVKDAMVQFGGSETQLGRKIIATVTADVYERTEGEA